MPARKRAPLRQHTTVPKATVAGGKKVVQKAKFNILAATRPTRWKAPSVVLTYAMAPCPRRNQSSV